MTTNKPQNSLPLPFELGAPSREDPTPVPLCDSGDADELDPVCTVEFAHYARALDVQVRTARRH